MSMSRTESPAADADRALEALSDLADSARSIGDPTEICSVLGSVHLALAYLEEALSRLRSHHDAVASERLGAGADRPDGGALPGSGVPWELRRAEGLARELAAALDRAYEGELEVAYDVAASRTPECDGRQPIAVRGLDGRGSGLLRLVRS